MKADREKAEVDPNEQTFKIKHSLQRYLEEKGLEDTKVAVVVTSDKLNDRMNSIYQDIYNLKIEQKLALKEDYTSEYIKASNDYTEFDFDLPGS